MEFLLNGRISNLNFAKLVYLYSPDINLEQLQVLDKIASGKNIMGTDISEKDFDLIKSFVTKNRGKSGKVSIKSILSNNKPLQLNDASMKSLESLILDYAKEKFKNENKIFSLNDIYARFDANKNTIRAILSDLKSNGILVRTSVGKYSLKK